MSQSTINLLGKEYTVIDVIDVAIADSFVKKNKIGRGNGEARLYMGSQKYDWDLFFNNFVDINCFFLKEHFLKYLADASFEYETQEQGYKVDILPFYSENLQAVKSLNEKENFLIYPANGIEDRARYYIRSDDKIYTIFREILLPIITSLSILKLTKDGNFYFLFRPFINYFEDSRNILDIIEEKKIIQNEEINSPKKEEILKARIGQGKYRLKLIDELTECLITKVNDERMLIASHIKPWYLSDENEKIGNSNGLLFTPTYDRLFDQGFISFENNGNLLVSPYLSPLNIRRLNLIPNKNYTIPNIEKRFDYLEFHRSNIFKKG